MNDSSPAEAARTVWMRGTGWSMFPTFRPGDLLRCEPLTREPELGDIVVLRRGGLLLIHRVTSDRDAGGLWRSKGDSMIASDPPFGAHEVVGIITARRRRDTVVALDPDPGRARLSLALGSRVARVVPLALWRLRRPLYVGLFLLASVAGRRYGAASS